MQTESSLTRTVQIAHRILGAAYKEAVRLGVVGTSPMDRVRAPAAKGSQVEAFHTPEQTHALLQAALDTNDQALIAFVRVGVETGARLSELAGLSWADVETVDGDCVITFRLQLAKQAKKWTRAPLKTAKSVRSIFLSKEAATAIEGQRLRQTVDALANPLGLVLLNEIGRPWEQSHVNKRLATLCEKAEVPYMSSHKSFRHSYATRALKAGASLHDASRTMGHSRPTLTGALYGHHTLDASKRVADFGQKSLTEAAERAKAKKKG